MALLKTNDLGIAFGELKAVDGVNIEINDGELIGLIGPNGAGKTTFVKLWKTYLKKEKSINSIYFSAWEDDFSKEPCSPNRSKQ